MTENLWIKFLKVILKLFVVVLACYTVGYAQTESWKEVQKIEIPDGTDHWYVDGQHNVYFTKKEQIQKVARTNLAAVQSIKEWQSIDGIEAINALKLMLFSAEQQQICFTDNTLSMQGECISLEELGLSNVTSVAVSKRPEMVWLYDEMNSQLILYNFMQKTITQSVNNLRGLLALTGTLQIKETQTGLWVKDGEGKVILMDDFMNEVRQYKLPNKYSVPIDENLYYLMDNCLMKWDPFTSQKCALSIQTKGNIEEFKASGNQLFLEFDGFLHVFIKQ
jgi:hypothetical protein